MFHEVLDVLEARVAALPRDCCGPEDPGARVEGVRDADQGAGSEPRDRRRRYLSVVFERPDEYVVPFFPFVGPLVMRGSLRELRDVSTLIFRCAVIKLADETLAPYWGQPLGSYRRLGPLRRRVRLGHTEDKALKRVAGRLEVREGRRLSTEPCGFAQVAQSGELFE